jgi:hypothetical protein
MMNWEKLIAMLFICAMVGAMIYSGGAESAGDLVKDAMMLIAGMAGGVALGKK